MQIPGGVSTEPIMPKHGFRLHLCALLIKSIRGMLPTTAVKSSVRCPFSTYPHHARLRFEVQMLPVCASKEPIMPKHGFRLHLCVLMIKSIRGMLPTSTAVKSSICCPLSTYPRHADPRGCVYRTHHAQAWFQVTFVRPADKKHPRHVAHHGSEIQRPLPTLYLPPPCTSQIRGEMLPGCASKEPIMPKHVFWLYL